MKITFSWVSSLIYWRSTCVKGFLGSRNSAMEWKPHRRLELSQETMQAHLRPYDRALPTIKACFVGLAVASSISLAGIVIFIAFGSQNDAYNDSIGSVYFTSVPSQTLTVACSVISTAVVTLCIESLGFLHTTSLRWALWQEHRLQFNTNLRLLTRSKTLKCNAWYTNVIWMFLAAASYAACGQIFYSSYGDGFFDYIMSVNQWSLLFLCIGLAGQTALAVCSLHFMNRHALTCSGNPINNTLVCYHEGLRHNASGHLNSGSHLQSDQRDARLQLSGRNATLASLSRFAVGVTVLLWIICAATFFWASMTYHYGNSAPTVKGSSGSAPSVFNGGNSICFKSNNQTTYGPSFVALFCSLAIQMFYTFALHCTELLVNRVRDQKTWDSACDLRRHGVKIDTSAAKEVFNSREAMFLLLLKTIVPWSFSESVQFFFTSQGLVVCSNADAIFLLASLTLVTAVFGSYLCFHRPPGQHPVTYGHFQTIVNLVDDWGADKQPLFWGDKAHVGWDAEGEIRRAGTSGDAKLLQPLRSNIKYIF